MLDRRIADFITKVIDTENSHLINDDENTMLSMAWDFVLFDIHEWVTLKISTRSLAGYWMHPVLYPESKVVTLKEQLPSFDIFPPSVAYSHATSGHDEHWIEPYWEEGRGFDKSAIPLFFNRFYYGRPQGEEHYVEFNQLVTHPLELHWVHSKSSYCSVNALGEEVENIKVINSHDIELILIRRRSLDRLLHMGRWVLVRYFQFTRWHSQNPPFDSGNTEIHEAQNYEGKFEIRKCGVGKVEYIEFRGAQIERAITPREQVFAPDYDDEQDTNAKRYANFIIWDWKNNRLLRDYSLKPDNFANYFTQSSLPFETSPIFFKAEVLDKYKGHFEKYQLTDRNITCRGGWHLETYDINEHNQVHTYAVYLARLPYKEQLHWLQYNEEPKGAISKRAVQTDFEGKWPDQPSPIAQLRASLEKMASIEFDQLGPVWSPIGGNWELATKGLYYVNTENPNQWHDFVIALSNATIEGFKKKPLESLAARLGNKDETLRTLGLIKFILEASGEGGYVSSIHGVLNDLWHRRGSGKAHGGWATPEGSLIADAEKRLLDVTNAIKKLSEIFEKVKAPP